MPEAIALYLMAAGAIAVVAVARIVVRRAQRTRPADLGRPYGHTELSILSGREGRPVLASLAALRAAGSIGVHSWGAFRAEGPLPGQATTLDRAVHARAAQGASLVTLNNDEGVKAALARTEQELRAAGAMLREPSPRFYSRVRWTALGTILGVAVVVPLFYRHSPLVGVLLFITAFPFGFVAVGIIERNAGRTRLGRRILEWATADDLATSVALNGVEALWAADPDFAQRGRLPRTDPRDSYVAEPVD